MLPRGPKKSLGEARRELEEKKSREQSAKWAADYSRDEWKGRTRRKKGESSDKSIPV